MASLGLLVSGVLLSGCGGGGGAGDGAQMLPGKDCSGCHTTFTVAGTVFRASGGGAEAVEIAVGGVQLTSNAAGNFYTAAPVAFPAAVEVRNGTARSAMAAPAPHGGCNGCHNDQAQPRLKAP